MSFPVSIQGRNGDQYRNSTGSSGLPLGSVMQLPDGREYVFAKAAATEIATGRVCQESAVVATDDVDLVVPDDEAIGQTKVTLTMQTVLAANHYQQGYLHVEQGTGLGYCYKIKSHPAETTGSGSCEFTLEDEDALRVAWVAGDTTCGLRLHPCDAVIIAPIDGSATGCVVGVTNRVVSASRYCWLQTKGIASVLTQGTVVLGMKVVRSTSTPGAVAPHITTGDDSSTIGVVSVIAANAEHSLINLDIR